MAKTVVTMKLCVRRAGKITCKDEGYKAEYDTATVGPTKLELSYPS